MLKSLFLPNEALQGQDIPSHILWDESVEYGKIVVEFPEEVKLKEVFNVKEYSLEDDILTIKSLDSDGYVGLVFGAPAVGRPALILKFRYLFYEKELNLTSTFEKCLTLYRI